MNFLQFKVFIVLTFVQKTFSQLPKPAYFDVQLDRFDVVESDKEVYDLSNIKVRKVNKIRSLVGEWIIKQPTGNDVIFEIKIYKKQGNEYRLLPYKVLPQPLCDVFSADGKFFNLFQR